MTFLPKPPDLHTSRGGAKRGRRLRTAVRRKETAAPYRFNEDLPSSVRDHLPEHAQDIYRQVFNHAHEAHAGDPRQEDAAHRIA